MPNGIYPIPTNTRLRGGSTSQERTSGPGPSLRLRTWLRRDRLDVRLSKGADPRGSATLELRAEQLGSVAGRVRLAEEIEGVLEAARRPATMSHLLLRRRQVQACAGELLELARRLRGDEPISLRGAAMTAVLPSDGRGPLYYEPASAHLREAVQAARLALDDVAHPSAPALSAAAA